jgi:hypothetical protein
MKHLVSYKYEVEEKAWKMYNINQVTQFKEMNKELIGIIKRIEKEYNNKPSNTMYEQFFYAVSKLQWI